MESLLRQSNSSRGDKLELEQKLFCLFQRSVEYKVVDVALSRSLLLSQSRFGPKTENGPGRIAAILLISTAIACCA
jgi:hypothetical protein